MKKINAKKILIIIFVIIIVFVMGLLSLNYTVSNNKDYYLKLSKDVKNNYNVDGDIDSINLYGNYYIIKTKNNVIVLDKEYNEILKETNSKIAENKNNYDLIYRTNKLMYEETVRDGNSLIYNYYDVYTYKDITSIVLE